MTALNPRHACPAQPRIAFQCSRKRGTAVIGALRKTFGEHGRILDRHPCALRREGQHGVGGIAEQRDDAVRPMA